jgi:hypothetical protein
LLPSASYRPLFQFLLIRSSSKRHKLFRFSRHEQQLVFEISEYGAGSGGISGSMMRT